MGQKSGLIAMAVTLTAASPAWAQAIVSQENSLNAVAFSSSATTTADGVRLAPAPRELDVEHPFRPPALSPPRSGAWLTEEVTVGGGRGAVDTLRFAVREERVGPSVAIASKAPYDNQDVAVSYVRGWPDAVQVHAGRYDLALSPHAGVGLSSMGTTAEAGAMLKLTPGKKSVEDRLGDLGVSDGSKYGDEGRWYLFAAASGRAVGLNMTRGDSGWAQSGWSTDKTSRLVGDGQLGVGFRKGAMQASFGYVYREIKVQNGPLGADTDLSDSMAAFSLSLKPNF